MKYISLTQDKVAWVDDSDHVDVTRFKWHAVKVKRMLYVRRSARGKLIYLHRYLLRAKEGEWVDHRDGDGLNCVRTNMRLCSRQQNYRAFRKKKIGASSQFFGVCWNLKCGKWEASLRIDKVKYCLGFFSDEQDAARAYNVAAVKRDPEFFNLNKVS